MKNKVLINSSALVCFFCALPSQAQVNYSIEYDKNSPLQNVPLTNADLRIQLFADGTPKGFLEVKTDDYRSFSFDEYKNFEILSIKGEEQYHAHCFGYGIDHATKVSITCIKRK